jgi:hypothetical protein
VLVQDNPLSFETASRFAQLRAQLRPWRRYTLEGATTLEVFKVTR